MSFKRIRKLVAPGYLLGVLYLSGCATARERIVTMNCVSDPLSRSFECVDDQGVDREIKWEDTANFICRTPADDKKLMDGSH